MGELDYAAEFPDPAPDEEEDTHTLTIRDYMAGQVIVACYEDASDLASAQRIAVRAYRIADAMLVEREKRRRT